MSRVRYSIAEDWGAELSADPACDGSNEWRFFDDPKPQERTNADVLKQFILLLLDDPLACVVLSSRLVNPKDRFIDIAVRLSKLNPRRVSKQAVFERCRRLCDRWPDLAPLISPTGWRPPKNPAGKIPAKISAPRRGPRKTGAGRGPMLTRPRPGRFCPGLGRPGGRAH